MSTQGQVSPRAKGKTGRFKMAPVAGAVALALAAGGYAVDVHAASPGGAAWFAAAGASTAGRVGQRAPMPGAAGLPSAARQQAQSRQQLSRSIANLSRTANAIAAQQAAQEAARANASNADWVRDGVGANGLDRLAAGRWDAAEIEAGVGADGRHAVTIAQNRSRAILEWNSFHVGRNTDVTFVQGSSDAVLNKVLGDARPSQIQGSIQANGTVMIVNQNGVVFTGTSQVNVRNLAAAAANITDAQFESGLYGANNVETFKAAAGKVLVEAGARIATRPLGQLSSTESGGYVLLVGKEVENAGAIHTPRGQALLAAGDSFVISKGQGTDGNQSSTTRGNEVTATGSGLARNTGLIQSPEGDITLTANGVEQAGVLLSSTSVNHRGTIHLSTAGAQGRVSLAAGGVSAILVDAAEGTALDSQRDALMAPTLDGTDTPIVVADAYRRDQSLVRIDSSGTVDFEGGSLTLATGGQVAVKADQRALLREGAVIDVAGAVGVTVAMEANSVKVNIQGNEQRDAPLNRESGALNSTDVWVDVRDLLRVEADYDAATNPDGYKTDRWYTQGGLLEVGGYLGTQGRTAGEWLAQGGTVSFTGNDVITQSGSQINLSGGTLDVQEGFMRQSWLRGTDGRLYEVSKAPGDILYAGLYNGYELTSERWGHTRRFYSPLIAPTRRWEQGYTVGRDAGALVVGTRNAVIEGEIVSEAYQGPRQTQAPEAGLDGYSQVQSAAARRGRLIVGSYTPYYVKESGALSYALTAAADTIRDVVLGTAAVAVADGLGLEGELPQDREGTLYLDTGWLNGFELGSVGIAARNGIVVEDALAVGLGGEIRLFAPRIEIKADLTARSGAISVGNVSRQVGGAAAPYTLQDIKLAAPAGGQTEAIVAPGVTLDARGVWSNQRLAPSDAAGLPYLNGGSVSIRQTGSVVLGEGSVVDVSSGAVLGSNGSLAGGRGGSLTLQAGFDQSTGALTLGGELRGHGVEGGGALGLQTGAAVVIGGAPLPGVEGARADTLWLPQDVFAQGFSKYAVTGTQGLTVADGAVVDVLMPVYRLGADAYVTATGTDPAAALEVWTPPLYQEDPRRGALTQRGGASLTLQAGTASATVNVKEVTGRIGAGAVVTVDPGQAITVRGVGSLDVQGRLNAWGGQIELGSIALAGAVSRPVVTDLSIWIGERAVLDVAGRAVAQDAQGRPLRDLQGRRYGLAPDGGRIVIGGQLDAESGAFTGTDRFVVVRPGALLDASGAPAVTVDLAVAGLGSAAAPTVLAGQGGTISLVSANGLYLEGDLRAHSGGAGTGGGSLLVGSGIGAAYADTPDRQLRLYELVLGQQQAASALADGLDPASAAPALVYGHARLAAAQVADGGFDSLTLYSAGMLAFDGDVDLSLRRELRLYAGSLGLAEGAPQDSRVRLAAPYVRLSGTNGLGGIDSARRWLGMHYGDTQLAVSAQPLAGRLRVEAGGLLDLAGQAGIGSGGRITLALPNQAGQVVDRRGFDAVELVSGGDLRVGPGQVYLPGDLTLAAAQIYPTTPASPTEGGARIHAGWRGNSAAYDPARTLALARTTDILPDVPHAVFGKLALAAATVEQGGVLRAPQGLITLGSDASGTRSAVTLLPGSITSTSSQGLSMPYGGTVDGIDWYYGEAAIVLKGAITNDRGVRIDAASVDVQAGALIDLSGGGELAGAGFVSGRGGSVNVLAQPLVAANPSHAYSDAGNAVYAIVPGYAGDYAPVTAETGAGAPLAGRQITLDGSALGLAPGMRTYTLLPSAYALLPGAFRVEIGATQTPGAAVTAALPGGSRVSTGRLGYAHTDIRESLARRVIVTPAATVRTLSQYNETSYAEFARADAALLGAPRPSLPADGQNLYLNFQAGAGAQAMRFAGLADFRAGQDGYAGTAVVLDTVSGRIEILAAGAAPTEGFAGVSLYAEDLNALGAARLSIGATPSVTYGSQGNYLTFGDSYKSRDIILREGAVLRAAEVLLLSGYRSLAGENGAIIVEAGAGIDTLGRGETPFDSRDGFVYVLQNSLPAPQFGELGSGAAMLAVSNGWLDVLPAAADIPTQGAILLGQCGASGRCDATSTLYSEGTIAFATNNTFELGENVRFGTRNLSLGVGAVNVGTSAALEAARAAGVLPSGLMLNQGVLDRLLNGDTSTGAPALEALILNASSAVNFFGTATLDTYDAAGQSRIDTLVFGTPAIYGFGSADDLATIRTESLVWAGTTHAPGAVITGGAGTGEGTLAIDAQSISFGYGPSAQVSGLDEAGRLALGFSTYRLTAAERMTANHEGSVAFYRSQSAYAPGQGYAYTGGDLFLTTPLVTGEAGSSNAITAGGVIRASAPQGALARQAAALADAEGLGASLSLTGASVTLDTAVALPSGKLAVTATTGDIELTGAARLDVAGRAVAFDDVLKYSWGGEIGLRSEAGGIRQAADSVIDLSAANNHAGRFTAIALADAPGADADAGIVDLQGVILGAASGEYDAGGTWMPYQSGGITVRAQRLGEGGLDGLFAALNGRLNAGEVYGLRSFQIKQGSLTIGAVGDAAAREANVLKANQIEVSIDGGALTLAGLIDASSQQVGSIRLSAAQGLALESGARLDAHGARLRVDNNGQIIDSPNRAIVELNAGTGTLRLAEGARIDVRHGVDDARYAANPALLARAQARGPLGTVALYAPRVDAAGNADTPEAIAYGDVAIQAPGRPVIEGAQALTLYAMQRYDDSDPDAVLRDGTDTASGLPYRLVDQDYLEDKHTQSTAFMAKAVIGQAGGSALNAALQARLAGLSDYAGVLHLRPGVEIASARDVVVSGDLDLSGHRYASINPAVAARYVAGAQPGTAGYGSGEAGWLTLRAAGDLTIHGSITDGFAPPGETPDDDGWMLRPGYVSYGADVIVPRTGVTLADGTTYPLGRALNYDVPVKAMTVPGGTQLPVDAVLTAELFLPANTILAGALRDAQGALLRDADGEPLVAGKRLAQALTLEPGTQVGAGFVAPSAGAAIDALLWPKGVALPAVATLDGDLTLPMGGLIPSQANLKLPGDTLYVDLRPADANGRQGTNWAVAGMLPAGTQSWSLRLVAGADLQAADSRLTRADGKGNLMLADTHYSVFDRHEITTIPGTPAQPGWAWYWSEQGAADWGMEAGTEISPDWNPNGLCADMPGWCEKVEYLWSELGPLFDPSYLPGTPILGENLGWCPSEVCIPAREPIPGTPDQTVVGDIIERLPLSPMFSVIRTGTGDLDLVAGGDIGMRSSYGVYTAGTQAADVSSVFDQPRATASGTTAALGRNDSNFTDSLKGYEDALAAYETLVTGGSSLYQAWYPEQGGNLSLKAGGNLTGDAWTKGISLMPDGNVDTGNRITQLSSANSANWLWRQGDAAGSENGAAWWINFGTYVAAPQAYASDASDVMPYLVGFTGYGTLGGGNLNLDVGGDAGAIEAIGPGNRGGYFPRSQGLVLAVASTGRVGADGQLRLTGGGDLSVRIGGALNPNRDALTAPYGLNTIRQNLDLNGIAANLRGHAAITAASQGSIEQIYSSFSAFRDPKDVRAADVFTSTWSQASGGLMLMPGDATFTLAARDDLALGGVWDGGRISAIDSNAQESWFSLWQPTTAIDLFAAGGNLTPGTQAADRSGYNIAAFGATAGRIVYPAILRAAAPAGSIYFGRAAVREITGPGGAGGVYVDVIPMDSTVLAPSPYGELELLAGQSIYAGGSSINRSSADTSVMPTPFDPATPGNLDALAFPLPNNLFAFGPDTASGGYDLAPARFYALAGDIVGLRTGEVLSEFGVISAYTGRTFYQAGGAVWMKAGRDIVNSGTQVGEYYGAPSGASGLPSYQATGNLIVHTRDTDVSIIQAGRDILYSSFDILGPGLLELTAGRNILMENRADLVSLGDVLAGGARPGASIVVQAGMNAGNTDWSGFLDAYLDRANLAAVGGKLADQPGRVPRTYDALSLEDWLRSEYGYRGEAIDGDPEAYLAGLQARYSAANPDSGTRLREIYEKEAASDAYLVNWLTRRYGADTAGWRLRDPATGQLSGTAQVFDAATMDARAYLAGLPAEQRRIYAREVYFAELRAAGREYNNVQSPRAGNYLRGRNAIAALFPDDETARGDVILYQGATRNGSIRTLDGGDIQALTPRGAQTYGVAGVQPAEGAKVEPAGLLTQGAGHIRMYSLGSILLGQSRIMTTFGGDIFAWSVRGDINAGRGSKSTLVYTPPRRVYDAFGNVRLSPQVPSTGAGIATLAPIPEVPAGDVDLIAPLGTIDAGEAGIRVSGNVNIAALQVVNAANIQVKGDAVGIPVVAAVNVGALTSASAAASSAADAAQESVARSRAAARQNLPSIISVQILGFGDESAPAGEAASPGPRSRAPYDASSVLQVVGERRQVYPQQASFVTGDQWRDLQQPR